MVMKVSRNVNTWKSKLLLFVMQDLGSIIVPEFIAFVVPCFARSSYARLRDLLLADSNVN